jgi:hypothetical protein
MTKHEHAIVVEGIALSMPCFVAAASRRCSPRMDGKLTRDTVAS